MTDDDRLRAECVAAVDAAAEGDLGEMLAMLDPEVRWYGEDGKPRASGADAVGACWQPRRRLRAALSKLRSRAQGVRADAARSTSMPSKAPAASRLLAISITPDGRIVAVEDAGSPEEALGRLAGHGVD
jgi:hypothetical protein